VPFARFSRAVPLPEVGVTVMHDLIKGIFIQQRGTGRFDYRTADGYPTYNFAVVVDDAQMGSPMSSGG